ncbi:MAG: DpnII family type II restriction endonuclease [Bacilli bacterium]
MFFEKDIGELSKLFVNNILETNRSFDEYVDWNNANKNNFEQFDVELNAMNCLIKNASKEQFMKLFNKIPTIVATFPLLIAVAKNDRNSLLRGKNQLVIVDKENTNYLRYNLSIQYLQSEEAKNQGEVYYNFFFKSGLQNLFENMLEKSIIDYVIGVLVGLDSNGRKNRSGKAFELLCEHIVDEIANKYGLNVITQKQFKVLNQFGFNVSNDIKDRKADFILVKDNKALNIEVDYFAGGGSKPEEIIDSYINRQNDLKSNGIGFVLITDGNCWSNKDKNQLQKGFRHLNCLLNFYLAKEGMLEEAIKNHFNF